QRMTPTASPPPLRSYLWRPGCGPRSRMMSVSGTVSLGEDWLQNHRVVWLWPAASLAVLGGWLVVSGAPGDLLAADGLAVAGGLCIGNAIRCRRVHCVVTGPLYLVAAGLFLGRAGGAAMPAAW